MDRRTVLFLCTGNSARSQMAEGLVNHFLGTTWEAHSAGTQPSGRVHPQAVTVMAELGIDISGHWSKSTDVFRDADFDLVITVCDNAARTCPAWLGRGCVIHIGFPDPAAGEGGDLAKLHLFRQVRDAIRERIIPFVDGFTDTPEDDNRPLHFVTKEVNYGIKR